MRLQSVSIVLFGLFLCCFLQHTAAQGDVCFLKLMFNPYKYPDMYRYTWKEEGDFSSPYRGWYMSGTTNRTGSLTSITAVEIGSPYCDYCIMKIFREADFTGDTHKIDFRTRAQDTTQFVWDFYAYSYTLRCFPPEPEEEEEEEIWEPEEEEEEIEVEAPEEEEEEEVEVPEEEEEEEIEVPEEEECCEEEIEVEPPEEEVEEEEEEDLSHEYLDAVFQQMNEGDGSTLPHQLVELRHKAVQKAINILINKPILPQGPYTTEKVFATEFATNYADLYRFNVQIRDGTGVEFRIWFTTLSYTEGHEVYQLVDAGYKENRIGEFHQTAFKVLPPVEESQQPYPAEVEDLRTKSLDQATLRLQAKEILPQTTVTVFDASTVEYSSIVNMTEYPNHDDMLYRFNARVVDATGALFRVFAIIATNYETPEFYELIDYGYKQSRLAEFTNTDWREMNEGEDLPLPGDIVQMRNRSVAQAIPRLKAEGILPAGGKYTISNTYATEFSGYFENPNIPYKNEDELYRFNVQLSNVAGEKFRVAVVVLTSYMIQPKYELIDYFYVENRLDEFTNTKFVSLDEGDLKEKSVNEAIGRMIAKEVLPGGQYTIAKTYPTELSPKFEHPNYSTDEYVLFKFTAQVNNAAGAGFKVFAVVITKYDDLEDYELIDYGKINA